MKWNNKSALALLCCYGAMPASAQTVPRRPNFVWFMAEDISKHYFQLYNEGREGVSTPNVEQMAAKGVTFMNAYSNAPVSSAARSTLITGCYAPRLGISLHRKLKQVPMPEGLNMFPSYLRAAGYHTSNAAKTDYNCMLDTSAWNIVSGKMGDWRKRESRETPFFHVVTYAGCHESCLHFAPSALTDKPTRNSPEKVKVHPYHPDTDLFRYTYATLYDRIQAADKQLGKVLDLLREDSLLDNTIVFFMGDNGGGLPGTKGYTRNIGVQVPLVAYIPPLWRKRLNLPAGEQITGLVSFMDLGPTLLHLAGIDVPKPMDGQPFLGPDLSPETINLRNEMFGYGDRFDELYAFNRIYRKGNYRYSRNFQPYQPLSLFAFYRYKQAAFREWKDLYQKGLLNAAQSRFFQPQGAEELYDLSADPYELHNLAGDQRYQKVLADMREGLKKYMLKQNDLGLIPEPVWLAEGGEHPTEYGQNMHKRLRRYSEIADLELSTYPRGGAKARKATRSADPIERYWAATAYATWGKEALAEADYLKQRTTEETVGWVRSRLLVALARMGVALAPEDVKAALRLSSGSAESLFILNDVTYLHETGALPKLHLQRSDVNGTFTGKDKCFGLSWRLDYLKQ